MKLLDGFCGGGGAGMGYHQAGFEVVGVDIKPQPRYPFEFVQADALEYIADHGHDFDVIHASPPCQKFSHITPERSKANHPDLIDPTRRVLQRTQKPYIIENVSGARAHLKSPIKLCGSMFRLKVFRHRFFEIYPAVILLTPPCQHDYTPIYVTGSTGYGGCGFPRVDAAIAEKRQAMDIDWMTTAEIDQAIPPAYTKWIGEQMLATMNAPSARPEMRR